MSMKILSVRYAEGKTRLKKHFHDAHQLLYIAGGSVSVSFGEETVTVGEGTLMIFHRFDEHSLQVLSDSYSRYSILVSPKELSEDEEETILSTLFLPRAEHMPQTVFLGEEKEAFEALLADMANEYERKEEFYEKKADLLFWQFLIMLYRRQSALFLSDLGRNAQIVQKIRRKMEENYSEKITLAELSSVYHVSLSHLTHVFKATTGYAPIEYLMECRLSAAKQMLSHSKRSIAEIVERCGFSDESNFSRTFKKKIGMSPSAFRKQYRFTE